MVTTKITKGRSYSLSFKKDKEGYYSFVCPITGIKYIVVFNKEIELYEKYDLVTTGDPEVASDAFVFKHQGDIFLSYNMPSHNSGVILHETVHMVNYMFQIIGQDLDKYNDELQAYYTQFLFNTITEITKEHFN